MLHQIHQHTRAERACEGLLSASIPCLAPASLSCMLCRSPVLSVLLPLLTLPSLALAALCFLCPAYSYSLIVWFPCVLL